MKKDVALILVVMLVVFSTCACSVPAKGTAEEKLDAFFFSFLFPLSLFPPTPYYRRNKQGRKKLRHLFQTAI